MRPSMLHMITLCASSDISAARRFRSCSIRAFASRTRVATSRCSDSLASASRLTFSAILLISVEPRDGARCAGFAARTRMTRMRSDIPLFAQHRADLREQVLGRERLGHIGIGSNRHSLRHLDVAPLGREHDDLDVLPRGILAHLLTQVVTTHARHHHVEQDQIGLEFGDGAQRVLARADNLDDVAALPHQELERSNDIGLVVGDQDLLAHSLVLRRCCTCQSFPLHQEPPTAVTGNTCAATAFATGNSKMKLAPLPGSLCTHNRPPRCSMICRLIGSPRPVPCGFSVIVFPAWRNFSKMIAWFSALIPGPLSVTPTRTVSAVAERSTVTRPSSGLTNFAAFDRRLINTCTRRSRSAVTCGTRSESRASSPTFLARKSCPVAAIESATTAFRSSSETCHSARPDSSLARSSTWLMSRVRRSLSWMMMVRNFCRSAPSSSGLSCRISEKARIEVSGVRSSCVTVEMKSSFSRSSSCKRSLAARSSSVAAISSRDFCCNSWL